MISQEEARARVARGAAHLDQVRPGWHHRIDVGTLTLHDPCGCIVGQLMGLATAGSFDAACRSMGIAAFCDQIEFGLNLSLSDDSEEEVRRYWARYHLSGQRAASEMFYQPLQDAWIEAICDRRLREVPAQAQATAPSSDAVDPEVAATGREVRRA